MHVHRTEAGPPGGAKPSKGQEPPEGFDALLALHEDEARTATAEGHKTDRGPGHDNGVRAHGDPSETPGHLRRAERDAAEEAEATPPEGSTPPAEAPAPDAPETPEAPAADVAPVVPDAAPVAPVAVAPVAPVAVPAGATTAADADAAAAAVAPVAVEADAAAVATPLDGEAVAAPQAGAAATGELEATGAAQPEGEDGQPVAAAVAKAGAEKPAAPATEPGPARGQEVAAAAAARRGEPSPNAKGARAAEVQEALDAGQRPAPAAESAAPPAPPQAPATSPVNPAAPVAADHTVRTLQLADTALRLRELVDVATARGVARARLQLHPAELGGIDVRLRVTSEGLTASIAAERPEAVQALQQAAAELKRTLEHRGLTVLSVDVTLAGPAGGSNGGQAQAGSDRSAGGATHTNGGQEAVADATEADPTTPRSVPAGALVDVLA
jgi:hypothetical protein